LSTDRSRSRFGLGASLLALAALGSSLTGIPWAVAASPPQVRGQGSGIYLYPPFTGDRVEIALESSSPSGRFAVTHFDKLGNVFDRLSGTVTCVSTTGNTASTTGTITAATPIPAIGDVSGKAFAITVVDNGDKDLVGLSYPLDEIPPCTSWPVNTVIDRGGYTTSG
jgi:hypothetical protein